MPLEPRGGQLAKTFLYHQYDGNLMAQKPSERDEITPTDSPGGLAKVTLLLGQDTVNRLDEIVIRGHFGGRGRALDALLDTLEDCVQDLEYWDLAYRHYAERGAPPEQARAGQNEMVARVERVRTKMERFFPLAEWDSPKLPWEENSQRKKEPRDSTRGREGLVRVPALGSKRKRSRKRPKET